MVLFPAKSSAILGTYWLPACVLYCMLCCVEGYGQTESTLLCGTFKKMNKWVKPGSIGKAAPGYDVRIVNNMGKEVPRGEQAGGQLAFQIFLSAFKGKCYEVDIFCRSKHFNQYFLCMH